ncbi:MAG TPA: VOC family protein [Casimicrobiaceae bacterium]|nr:VOC family protein [Casimicrobiaceae bacterium]
MSERSLDRPPRFTRADPILASLDIARTVAFYRDRLGFSEVYVEPGRWAIMARDDVRIHFWPCEDRRIAESTACRVYVDGIDALYREIEPQNVVHPNAPLADKPWGAREFGVTDEDGNLITFAGRLR